MVFGIAAKGTQSLQFHIVSLYRVKMYAAFFRHLRNIKAIVLKVNHAATFSFACALCLNG